MYGHLSFDRMFKGWEGMCVDAAPVRLGALYNGRRVRTEPLLTYTMLCWYQSITLSFPHISILPRVFFRQSICPVGRLFSACGHLSMIIHPSMSVCAQKGSIGLEHAIDMYIQLPKGPHLCTPTAAGRVEPGQVLSPIYRLGGGL